jgi:hypothetical protein
VRELVEFTWEVGWAGGAEIATCKLRIYNALGRGIPLPDKWDVALSALKLEKDARRIHRSDLPLDVPDVLCHMLGVAKKVQIPQAGARSPGACVMWKPFEISARNLLGKTHPPFTYFGCQNWRPSCTLQQANATVPSNDGWA